MNGRIVAAGCPIDMAIPYGDCLTYEGGHAEHWEQWQQAGSAWLLQHQLPLAILNTEYDAHPRGRVVKSPTDFIIYADKRLQNNGQISAICHHFGLKRELVSVLSDLHYQNAIGLLDIDPSESDAPYPYKGA